MGYKLAIIEVRVMLPSNFRPRTLTYRTFSTLEKISDYVRHSAEEKFANHVLEINPQLGLLGLKRTDLTVRSSVKIHTVHAYIPAEDQAHIEKSHEQA